MTMPLLSMFFLDGKINSAWLPYLVPGRVLFVNEDYNIAGVATHPCYADLESALAYANASGDQFLIILYPGVYVGNFNVSNNILLSSGEVELQPYDLTEPTLYINQGAVLGWPTITDDGNSVTNYMIQITVGAKLEIKEAIGGYGAVEIKVASGNPTVELEIDADKIDRIYDSNTSGNVNLRVFAKVLSGLKLNGNTFSKYQIVCHEFNEKLEIDNGNLHLEVLRYTKEDTKLFEIDGGEVTASGRLEDYDDSTDSPIIQTDGTLRLNNFFAKNQNGGVVEGSGGAELKIGNSVLEAGNPGGGLAPTIFTGTTYNVKYINQTSLNSAPSLVAESLVANKLVDAAVEI